MTGTVYVNTVPFVFQFIIENLCVNSVVYEILG